LSEIIDYKLDKYVDEVTKLQIGIITKLKNNAIQNKDKISSSYLQGFVKACDVIIEIFNDLPKEGSQPHDSVKESK
jgi:hypothetical protein